MSAHEDRPIWLTTLADADREVSAPQSLESRLVSSMRWKLRLGLARRAGAVLAVAAAILASFWLPSRLQRPADAAAFDSQMALDDNAVAELVASMGEDETAKGEFVATHLASAQPLESVRIERVSMPSAQLSSYGVSPSDYASADEVTADLLIGQDGIARAIRVLR